MWQEGYDAQELLKALLENEQAREQFGVYFSATFIDLLIDLGDLGCL